MMFSTLNIYKPLGITSHDVVSRLRRIFNLKRIGHLGTLDPLAEGVLPVCLGQATRLIEYFPSGKRYTAEVTIGRTTTTLDREGEVLSEIDCTTLDLSPARLESVLQNFRGTITQQVPLYSAVHVDGKKLYELARQGKSADLPSREVTIESLRLLDIMREDPAHPTLHLDIACSSGTYIRSLARDIGEHLGCGAYLSALLRTEHGRFTLESSVSLDTLKDSAQPHQYLLSPADFITLPAVLLNDETQARRLLNGMHIERAATLPAPSESETTATRNSAHPASLCLIIHHQQPLAVAEISDRHLQPVKVFPPH